MPCHVMEIVSHGFFNSAGAASAFGAERKLADAYLPYLYLTCRHASTCLRLLLWVSLFSAFVKKQQA